MTGEPGPAERTGAVFVVDDDAGIRGLVRAALEAAGFAVVEAADGAEALRRARETAPELVLLDLDMPVLDGPSFVAAYRAGPEPHAPVVVMSASTDGADAAAWLGAVGYLRKPFTMRALVTLVAGFATTAGSAGL
jgi:CheY-like chemotaxis protein